jgi:outer membrane murein-binding lipoprotein Lpp
VQPVQPPLVAQPAAVYAPVAAYPAAQSAKSSGGALKIILIIIAVVVGLGLLAGGVVMYGVYKVAHVATTDSKGNTTIAALGANISAGKDVSVSAADLGVPIYPGAQSGQGGMHMTLPTMSMVSAVYTTSDPMSSVVAFYKGKLGENESDMETSQGSVMSSGKEGPNGKSGTVITIGPGSGDSSGKTRISIVRTTSTAQ